jgi:hypothetical protein
VCGDGNDFIHPEYAEAGTVYFDPTGMFTVEEAEGSVVPDRYRVFP